MLEKDFVLKVPYYSQHRDVKDPTWRHRACGIACFKMALAYAGKETPPLDEMIHAHRAAAYQEGVGWKHMPLVDIAVTEYGLKDSYRKEYREVPFAEAFLGLVSSLKNNCPPIVSIFQDESRKGSHLIVLTGFRVSQDGGFEGVRYHDPDSLIEEEKKTDLSMDIPAFEKRWRKLAIFIGAQKA
ncbi:MAG: C39 family peptidase [Candidatus Lloydbacteria bacterium]|nr:C39 family peptidase [Candidatus Lloydbacteria bacterium]